MKFKPDGLFNFYLYGNFHIAFCAATLTHLSCLLLHIPADYRYLLIAFLGTLAFYSFQRYIGVLRKEDYEARDERHRWNFSNKKLLLLLVLIPSIPLGWMALQLHTETVLLLAATGALSLIYASPLFRVNGKWIRLRDFPAVKVFLVGIVWSAVVVGLPATEVYTDFGWHKIPGTIEAVTGWALIMFLVIIGLTIPFDIRDLAYDPASIRSLPMIIGEKKAVRLSQIFILAAAVLFYFISKSLLLFFSFENMLAFSLWSALTIWILNDCSSKKQEYYFSFVIDGLLILLWLFLAGKNLIQ